jgi:hypothetical protein
MFGDDLEVLRYFVHAVFSPDVAKDYNEANYAKVERSRVYVIFTYA